MRIVQISTDTLPVPPPKYGGIQRVIHSLTEDLVNMGHEVFLYAPKGSVTSATLIPYEHRGPNNQKIAEFVKKTLPPEIDLIHDHTHFSIIDQLNLPIPTISTIHINNSNFPRYPVYISQRALEDVGNNQGFCIYNGIDLKEYEFSQVKKDYLLFLGEVSQKKGIHHAIEIAEKTNRELLIAGPIFDRKYFNKEVAPKMKQNTKIKYIGETGGTEKQELLKYANCLLFPITWREPFGLVMVEAMACGTPVLALNNGSVPEVMGAYPELICNDTTEMIDKVEKQTFPQPEILRNYVEDKFSKEKMVDSYLKLYEKIVHDKILPINLTNRGYNKLGQMGNENNIKSSYHTANMYIEQGKIKEAKEKIFDVFKMTKPTPDFCCLLGFCFMQEKLLNDAIFWFELAIKLGSKDYFIDEKNTTWVPHLKLCICYYDLGDYEKSYKHNEILLTYFPNDPNIKNNKEMIKNKMRSTHKVFTGKQRDANEKLRIVQVAPDIYSLPSVYGGIEKIVYELTEELCKLGHEVYLFAPKGTNTSATLIPYTHQGTWKSNEIVKQVKTKLPGKVDIIHDHTHYSSIGKNISSIPTLCSIHISSNNYVKNPVYVSEYLLKKIGKNNGRFVHNGIRLDEYQFNETKEDYFLYLSRLSKQKGTHFALDICEKANLRLKIAGPISNQKEYKTEFESRIMSNPNIEYLGSVEGQEKQDLLKNARCMLFPTNCDEAFGLVMVEAMACGTPVLALANGAVSEVLRGFPELICYSVEEMMEKALNLTFPTSSELRNYVEEHFSISKMTDMYVKLYRDLIQNQQK